jgi:TnpA family transposase
MKISVRIREGTVSASLIMGKLGSYLAKTARKAMNGLARAIFSGKQGELRERTIQHQLQRASALKI